MSAGLIILSSSPYVAGLSVRGREKCSAPTLESIDASASYPAAQSANAMAEPVPVESSLKRSAS
jgi:hypothetical protein